jgi:5-methyltetrahydrofolate--homocysteine methyltransferase
MKENLEEFNRQGIKLPVLLGGAALTRSYAEESLAEIYGGPLFYCRDAFDGLAVMNRVCAGQGELAAAENNSRAQRRRELRQQAACARPAANGDHEPLVRNNPIPAPPFWGSRVVRDVPVSAIFPFINELALFRGQWGFRKGALSEADFERLTEEKARPVFKQLQQRAIGEKLLEPMVVYGWFPTQAQGDDLIVYHPDGFTGLRPSSPAKEWLRFSFPRQQDRRKLCIADFFRSVDSGEFDSLGVQVVTMGPRVSEQTARLFEENRYQEYLYLHGFAVECAEALAELWHKRMRQELGFGGEDAPTTSQLFQQGYRGSRYSFGYPACPDLQQREKIMQLLDPGRIGLNLSENFMLVPEQSTDALVVHHPQARYFDV